MKKENVLHEDMQKIKEKMKETSEAIAQTSHDVKNKAGEILQDSWEELKHKSHDIEKSVVKYVRENPLKSVGFGVLTGAFIALLLKK